MARYEHFPIYKEAMELGVYLDTVVRNCSFLPKRQWIKRRYVGMVSWIPEYISATSQNNEVNYPYPKGIGASKGA
jgi:hypothetical protein